jgi:hypothetical protein
MSSRFLILLKAALTYASILLVTLIAADAVFYLLLPIDTARKFDGYKVEAEEKTAGRLSYPKDYFVSPSYPRDCIALSAP